jgi:hypothetical protein
MEKQRDESSPRRRGRSRYPKEAMLAELGFDPKAEGEYSFTLSNGCTVGFVFDEPSPAKSKRIRKAV